MTPHWRECEAPLRRTQRDGADETVLCRSQAPLGKCVPRSSASHSRSRNRPRNKHSPCRKADLPSPIGIPGEFFHTLSRGATAPNGRSSARPAQRIKTPKTLTPSCKSLPWSGQPPAPATTPRTNATPPTDRHSGIFIPRSGMKISGISRASGPERPPLPLEQTTNSQGYPTTPPTPVVKNPPKTTKIILACPLAGRGHVAPAA